MKRKVLYIFLVLMFPFIVFTPVSPQGKFYIGGCDELCYLELKNEQVFVVVQNVSVDNFASYSKVNGCWLLFPKDSQEGFKLKSTFLNLYIDSNDSSGYFQNPMVYPRLLSPLLWYINNMPEWMIPGSSSYPNIGKLFFYWYYFFIVIIGASFFIYSKWNHKKLRIAVYLSIILITLGVSFFLFISLYTESLISSYTPDSVKQSP